MGAAFLAWGAVPTTAQGPVGNEFQVNSYTTSFQLGPTISHGPAADFVVAWSDLSGREGAGVGIFGRRFTSDGLPLAGDFQINSFTTYDQVSPAISHDPSGGFVVAWHDLASLGFGDAQDGSGSGIFGQRFSSDGLPAAGEFQIHSFTTGNQTVPTISHAPSGGFVVAWEGSGIFAQRFGADGLPVAGEFQVHSVGGSGPTISHAPSGGFVVAWSDFSTISGRRFGSDGLALAGDFQINSDTTGSKLRPAISHAPSGGFVVAWTDVLGGQDGDTSGVFGQRFGSDGLPMAGEFQVNSFTTGSQTVPTISHDPSGGFVVLWQDSGQDGSGLGIFGQRYAPDGFPVEGEFRVNSTTAGGQQDPTISHDPSGHFVVAWQDDSDGSGSGIFGQRFHPPPVLSLAPACADRAEGDAGTTGFTFIVTRSGDTTGASSVDYAVTGSGDDPAAADDFGGAFPSGTVLFGANDTSETITLDISGDTTAEMDEGFTVTLESPVDAAISVGTADGTIRDDDALLSIEVFTEIIDATGDGNGHPLDGTVASAVDGAGNAVVAGLDSDNVFRITLGGAITEIIDATGDGGNMLSGVRDVAVDASGNVYVTGFDSDNVFEIAPDGTITQILDATGDGSGATLSGPIGVAVDGSGNVYVAGNISNNAFQITPGGVITEIIDVTGDGVGSTLIGARDVAVDSSGNVVVTGYASNNAFRITPGGVITEIIDSAGDGVGNTLSGILGVAVDGSDNVYVTGLSSSNAFRIAPGGAINEILDDSGDGAGNWLSGARDVAVDPSCNVVVTGFGSNNAFRIAPGGAISEIIDATGDGVGHLLGEPAGVAVDRSGEVVVAGFATHNAFRIGTSAVRGEGDVGNTGFRFTVTRTGDTSGAATASWAVTGVGAHPADAADFGGLLPSGTVEFAPNDAEELLTVEVSGDTVVEMHETFEVTVGFPENAAAGTARADGIIWNDDASLSIASTSADQAEGDVGNTSFTFTVTRSGDTSQAASADYGVTGSGGDAADAVDFGGSLPSGSVLFAAAETQQVLTIDVSGDSIGESDEGFTVTLNTPVGATIGAASAEGIIRNDDSAISIQSTDADKAEGDEGATSFTFSITRTGDTSGPSAVDYEVTGSGTNPAGGADFGGSFPSGTVNFVAADTSETVTVDVSGDLGVEADEGFTVTLINPSRATTIGTAVAEGVIRNDDVATGGVAGEGQVNSMTAGDQKSASVATQADGSFVVVWASDTSLDTDTDGKSIQGQRFAEDRTPIGNPFQVNTYTPGAQDVPVVATSSVGGFVVVWQSLGSGGTDADSFSVHLQRFGSDGMPQGGELQVNTFSTSHQYGPSVATDSNGGFVVVWTSNGSSNSDTDNVSVQGQRFGSDGTALGGQFQVNTSTTFFQRGPVVATQSDGDFVVVWESGSSPATDTDGHSIQGQLFASDGMPQGGEFQVNTYTTSHQYGPSVATDSDGDFVVVWTSNGSSDSDTDNTSVQGQRFGSDGTALGAEIQLNVYTPSFQRRPALAAVPEGDFVVTWESGSSPATDTDGHSVQGQRFASDASPIGGPFQINSFTTSHQRSPEVSTDSTGRFVVVWESDGSGGTDSSGYSIQMRSFSFPFFADGFESGDTTSWSP